MRESTNGSGFSPHQIWPIYRNLYRTYANQQSQISKSLSHASTFSCSSALHFQSSSQLLMFHLFAKAPG
jgi:hypothetical protein